MKGLFFILLLAGFVSVCHLEKHIIKYDNMTIEEILRNSKVLNSYVHCFMNRGKCTTDGEELKKIIPDAMQTRCKSCSLKQKAGIMRMIAYISANKPGAWRQLQAKYDPKLLYVQRIKSPEIPSL